MSGRPKWADTAAAIESGDFARLAAAAESAIARIIEIGDERDALADRVLSLEVGSSVLRALHQRCKDTHSRNPLSRYDVAHLRSLLEEVDDLIAGVFEDEEDDDG